MIYIEQKVLISDQKIYFEFPTKEGMEIYPVNFKIENVGPGQSSYCMASCMEFGSIIYGVFDENVIMVHARSNLCVG